MKTTKERIFSSVCDYFGNDEFVEENREAFDEMSSYIVEKNKLFVLNHLEPSELLELLSREYLCNHEVVEEGTHLAELFLKLKQELESHNISTN